MAKKKRRSMPASVRKQELLAQAEHQERLAANCRAEDFVNRDHPAYIAMALEADVQAAAFRRKADAL